MTQDLTSSGGTGFATGSRGSLLGHKVRDCGCHGGCRRFDRNPSRVPNLLPQHCRITTLRLSTPSRTSLGACPTPSAPRENCLPPGRFFSRRRFACPTLLCGVLSGWPTYLVVSGMCECPISTYAHVGRQIAASYISSTIFWQSLSPTSPPGEGGGELIMGSRWPTSPGMFVRSAQLS